MPVITKPSHGSWGLLHYYLGAKYLPELGYFDLYRCLIKTQIEQGQAVNYPVRELSDYTFVAGSNLSSCPVSHFSPERWQQFKQDSQFLINRGGEDFLSQAIQDKGFNPPPSWAAIAGPLANILPLHNVFFSKIIFNLDLFFVMLTGFIIWRSAGYRLALISLILTLGYFGTLGLLGNNFLQYAWLPLFAGAVSAWRSKRPALSGCLLACASGLQVFPGIFAVAIGLLLIICLLQKRYVLAKFTLWFLAAFTVGLVFWFALGTVYGKGPHIWQNWNSKISLHKSYLQGEVFDIGLPSLIGTTVAGAQQEVKSYLEDYKPAQARQLAFKDSLPFYLSICCIMVFSIIVAIWRNPHIEPFGYGYIFMYLGLSLSPYYYLILALLPFTFWSSTQLLRHYVLLACLILFILQLYLFWPNYYVSFEAWPHLLSQLSIASFLWVLLIVSVLTPQNNK